MAGKLIKFPEVCTELEFRLCARFQLICLSEVHRDGGIYQQEYFRGKPKANVKKVGDAKDTGTIQTFEADPEIFTEIKYDPKRILNHLRQQAYLTKGVRITFRDERKKGEESSYTFYFEGGVGSYVKYLVSGKYPKTSQIFFQLLLKKMAFLLKRLFNTRKKWNAPKNLLQIIFTQLKAEPIFQVLEPR